MLFGIIGQIGNGIDELLKLCMCQGQLITAFKHRQDLIKHGPKRRQTLPHLPKLVKFLPGHHHADVFFATRFLNHALFDFGEEHRWSASFTDVWDPHRPSAILLDHIIFTQAVAGSNAMATTGMRVGAQAGRVEHEIHNAVNVAFDSAEDFTSDHRTVTVDIQFEGDPVT